MNRKIIILCIAAFFAGDLFAQGLNEFAIGKDYNSQEVFHKSKGCTPDDGVIVFSSNIPNLKFAMVDTPKRLKNVPAFDAKNSCYVLCIQPTDKNIGGITKYSIDITADGYKRAIIDINEVRATETQYFTVKSNKDVLQELEELKQRLANLENKAVTRSNPVDIEVRKDIDSQPKEENTTVKSINDGQAIHAIFDSDILFDSKSIGLTRAAKKSLTKLANDLKANPNTNVEIYGYTDSKENNIPLSEKRATVAAKDLEKEGIPLSRLITEGLGSSQPIADNNTKKGRAQNRRAEIYIKIENPKTETVVQRELARQENKDVSKNGKKAASKKQSAETEKQTAAKLVVGIEMVFVKGDTLPDFYIGKTEVTQALWKTIMGKNPSLFKGDNLPVEKVSWDDIQKFLVKLNQRTGMHYRLPTTVEWEYAARGGAQSLGYEYSGSNTAGNVAWYSGNSAKRTHPVASKQPNELGIYDMSGNVWEWCATKSTIKIQLGSCWKSKDHLNLNAVQVFPSNTKSDSAGFRLAHSSDTTSNTDTTK
jgi:outer membrane protein OmpA-like peptidoglycan-associated protein